MTAHHRLTTRAVRATAIAAGGALTAALLAAAPAAGAAESARASTAFRYGLEHCTGTAPITCTFPDLTPGHYNVAVVLGADDAAASTNVYAESRRLMIDETRTAAGEHIARAFTVNVRDPEGQQNAFNGRGNPGLTLAFAGTAPRVAHLLVTPTIGFAQRLVLFGDSTVTDQDNPPYTGWGQRLPAYFRPGLSVINHSGSGESTISMLENPEMFDAAEPQLRRGDVALIQLAHNDKTTTAEQYRANLAELVDRIRARGATPVLVTPIVRLRFSGAVLNSTGLIVTDLADLPAEMRRVAEELDVPLIDLTARSKELVEGLGPVGAEPIYLFRVNGDRTHTSEYGASVYAGIVAEELRGLGLIADWRWR
ncbi:rhamnogalacturonan acetylesterase [Agromyces sp. LHK192]|uniref:rhamnogalacturonan acetylesterase n=1 Tax=Agromyces sp. LHK192 TaxID=2498704 RepID=UPI000FDB325A|nr:rhamnogalacturonan acetylesterase [Agromyces sp. LHK192]